jgi:hypothetical protein
MDTTIVFDNYDICYIIWEFLDVPTIGALSSVSKLTFQLYKDVYKKRIKKEYIDKANGVFDIYIKHGERLIFHIYDSYIISNAMIHVNQFMKEFIDEDLWIALVNDSHLMEKIFYELAFLNRSFKQLKSSKLFDEAFETETYTKVQHLFDSIDKYMYIEHPEKYNVIELKHLASFKQIKKCHSKKRTQLISSLRRPKNESYYLM